jgi:hypothetical protein
MYPNDLRHVRPSDEVAVMPMGSEAPHRVLKIAKVRNVEHSLIQTTDGGMYVADGGGDVNLGRTLFIEPVTDEHRQVLVTRAVLRGEIPKPNGTRFARLRSTHNAARGRLPLGPS